MRDLKKQNREGEANMKTTVTKIMDKIKNIDNVIDGLYKYRENVFEIQEAIDLLREYRTSILNAEVDM
jgi:ACT domain-containing protein